MSQATPNAPSVVVNAANSRQQVPLRDYLNARVAPFLKKAVTDSLGIEAEFPLQWLGECLIHQSILYEGNPDKTNIRERFLYQFEDPKPQEQEQAVPAAPSETIEAPQEGQASQESEAPQPSQPAEVQQASESTMDATAEPLIEPSVTTQEPVPHAAPETETPVVNGVKAAADAKEQDAPKDGDTEMGGTT